jgi:hypothetical protein
MRLLHGFLVERFEQTAAPGASAPSDQASAASP